MRLLIDDKRTEIEEVDLDIIAKTYEAGYLILCSNIDVIELYMDHDLGSNTEEDNGYSLLKKALEHKDKLKKVVLVTNNPVGRANMTALLLEYGFEQQSDPTEFVR